MKAKAQAQKKKAGRPPAFTSPEELAKLCEEYFEECRSATREIYSEKAGAITINIPDPFLISGLCLHLHITRETLNQYSKKPGYSDVITRARAECENDTVKRLFDKNQCNGAKFLLSAKYGYKDVQKMEGEITHKGVTIAELAEQYEKAQLIADAKKKRRADG